MDGHRGGDRLHDGPPGQRRDARHAARPGRHRDRRLGRPRLDPRRLPALAGQAAPVPPRPARQAREDARARRRGRRRRARGRRRRLLDGGRRRRPAADRRALPRARRAADGRRGARRRRARRARRRRERAARGRGATSTCGWARSPRASPPAAASSPAATRSIDFLRISSRAFMFTAAAVPAAVGAALAALRIVRSEEGPQLFAPRARERRLPVPTGCATSAST